jgi:hypothetical protein
MSAAVKTCECCPCIGNVSFRLRDGAQRTSLRQRSGISCRDISDRRGSMQSRHPYDHWIVFPSHLSEGECPHGVLLPEHILRMFRQVLYDGHGRHTGRIADGCLPARSVSSVLPKWQCPSPIHHPSRVVAGVSLSLSTQSSDLQTRRSVSTPSITVSGSRVAGNLEAVSAMWRWININQGSPKPGGGRPGLTSPVSGHYNQKTHRYSMTWTSQIVQGPFVGFIGEWHLEGMFVPSR